MIQLIDNFLSLFKIPLSFLPDSIQLYLSFVVGFFSIFYIGRAFRWLWDMLPIA